MEIGYPKRVVIKLALLRKILKFSIVCLYCENILGQAFPQSLICLDCSDKILSNSRQKRTVSIIKILVVQALAYEAKGDLAGAIAAIECVLILAEPEGYVGIFAECGPPMARLLREAMTRSITPTYTERLLTASATWGQPQNDAAPASGVPTPQPLIEPLSQRELEVLRLLNTELSGPEIARELVVALSTVRTHTKRIYSKLNVTNRRAAVKRAAELDLI